MNKLEFVYTDGTSTETLDKNKEFFGIRCYVDDKHNFIISPKDAPETMNYYESKGWCEENYCRLPMKHELNLIGENLILINKMMNDAAGEPFKDGVRYWSSSEYSSGSAWLSILYGSYGLNYAASRYDDCFVRPVLTL
jgi:hypothetical protein